MSSGPSGARPTVTVHYAQTLDGRIATRTRNSQWISGERSLVLAHQLRASHEAVMVGIGTVVADDPKLTVRLVPGPCPLRVVADSTLRLPDGASLLTDGAARTLVVTTSQAPRQRVEAVRQAGVEVLEVAVDDEGHCDLEELLAGLAAAGVRSLLVEGGGCLITSFLRHRFVDRLVVCIAPKVLGSGIEAVGDLDIRRLSDALTFSTAQFVPLGEDVIFDGILNGNASGDGAAEDGARGVVSGAADGRAPAGAAPLAGA